MKLKNMKKLYFFWGLIIIALVALLTTIGFLYKSKEKDFLELESKLVEQSQKYVDQHFLYPQGSEQVRVKLTQLQEDGLIESFKREEDTCDGYVVIKKDGMSYSYKGYIKCDNYETNGYNKNA